MKDQITISRNFKIITYLLIAIGALTIVLGVFTDRQATWTNYLVVNYYFFSLAIGGAFFYVLQSISQSGWSSAFKRVPEAMMAYLPFAALFFLLLWFGMQDIYHWANKGAALDEAVQHKSVYLNIPFFFIRVVLFFLLWIIFAGKLRQISLQEDKLEASDINGIMNLFGKTELYSKIFLFILSVTVSLSAVDWMMSVDVKWYSTIFALKNLVAACLHGVSIITLIVFILYKKGYFPFFNEYHLHDFARYIFMFSIVWGYFWFAQFMIIWYGNIPEETVYFSERWKEGWKILFFLEIGLNWFLPFMILLPVKASRNMTLITIVIIFLIIGQYIDIFTQVIPGSTGALKFGWISIGTFLGYAGLFALVVATALSKAKIIPANHPYLNESLEHKF
jgi:hypothetical protein